MKQNHVDMEEKKLTYKDVPMDYPLCFNGECTKSAFCMHYQARLLLPANRHHGPAVYPTAWQDGACKYFREKKLVQKAWGFTHLYDNVPRHQRAEARQCVHSLFGCGNGPYYRAHHGEIMLSPEKQESIMEVISEFGSTDGIRFDHYVEDWDFG